MAASEVKVETTTELEDDVDSREEAARRCKNLALETVPYRQLQHLAKMCGVPCNIKKEILRMIITAKIYGRDEEVKFLLKNVQESRLIRKQHREKKAQEKAKAMQLNFVEENSNKAKKNRRQKTVNMYKMLRDVIKKTCARNVTVEKTSTHTRFRALIAPPAWPFKNSTAANTMSTITTNATSTITTNATSTVTSNATNATSTITSNAMSTSRPISNSRKPCDDIMVRYAPPPTTALGNLQTDNCANNDIYPKCTSTAILPVTNSQQVYQMSQTNVKPHKKYSSAPAFPWSNQYNYSQSNYGNNYSRMMHTPAVAVSVKETLFHKYRTEPAHNTADGNVVYHQSKMIAGSRHLQPISSAMKALQWTNEVSCNQYLPAPTPNYVSYAEDITNVASSSCNGVVQQGIQGSCPPTYTDDCYVGGVIRHASAVPTCAFTEYSAPPVLQYSASPVLKYSGHNNVPLYDVHYPNKLAPFDMILKDEVVPDVTSSMVDRYVANQNNYDSGLGLLANTAMTQSQAIIKPEPQQYDNGLHMEGRACIYPTVKNEIKTNESKKSLLELLTWPNFMDQMSKEYSPGASHKQVFLCKHGCHRPLSSRQQQLDHEEQCYLQPQQCPLPSCCWVGNLVSTTTHLFNYHNHEIKVGAEASFLIDLSPPNMFESGPFRSESNPTRLCFLQLADRRLFIISVIGNFNGTQVAVYVQYVNDHLNCTSYAALEVARADGAPYQWTGQVFPLTYNSMHLIIQSKCLKFSVNFQDMSQCHLVVHTKISNQING